MDRRRFLKRLGLAGGAAAAAGLVKVVVQGRQSTGGLIVEAIPYRHEHFGWVAELFPADGGRITAIRAIGPGIATRWQRASPDHDGCSFVSLSGMDGQ